MTTQIHRHSLLTIVASFLLSAACTSAAEPRAAVPRPLIIAHRGASHDAPENTLAAFRLAFERGADGIEGDFYLTRDKRMVCIHDADTKRVAGTSLAVAHSSLAELKRLDVGGWKGAKWHGERVPTIEEVIGVIPPDKMFFIELKIGPEVVTPLKTVLARSTLKPRQCVIISFDADTIVAAKRQLPEIKAHWLSGHRLEGKPRQWRPTPEAVIKRLQQTGADGFGSQANLDSFDAPFIQRLRSSGYAEFHVWTVNKGGIARFYQEQGALGITTDRPAYLRARLAEAQTVISGD